MLKRTQKEILKIMRTKKFALQVLDICSLKLMGINEERRTDSTATQPRINIGPSSFPQENKPNSARAGGIQTGAATRSTHSSSDAGGQVAQFVGKGDNISHCVGIFAYSGTTNGLGRGAKLQFHRSRATDGSTNTVLVEDELIGKHITLPFPSVGATENILMAASMAKGKTIIENAAREPEINDLAFALNKMGAKINVKKNGIIKIDGVNSLTKATHKIMSDRIVAGTFVIAAVMLNKKFEVKDIESNHLEALTSSLTEMGAKLKIKKTSIQIIPTKKLNGIKIQTAPYPGFPTDLQAQIMALMSLVNGNSQIKENIFENRFMHVPESLIDWVLR